MKTENENLTIFREHFSPIRDLLKRVQLPTLKPKTQTGF